MSSTSWSEESAFGVVHKAVPTHVLPTPFAPRKTIRVPHLGDETAPGQKEWQKHASKYEHKNGDPKRGAGPVTNTQVGRPLAHNQGYLLSDDKSAGYMMFQRKGTIFRRPERSVASISPDGGAVMHVHGGQLKKKNVAIAAGAGTAAVGGAGAAAYKVNKSYTKLAPKLKRVAQSFPPDSPYGPMHSRMKWNYAIFRDAAGNPGATLGRQGAKVRNRADKDWANGAVTAAGNITRRQGRVLP